MIKPHREKHEGAQGKGLRIKGRESLPVYPLPIPKQSCAYTQITECLYPNSNVLPDDARVNGHTGTGTEVNPESWTQLKGSR